MRYEDVPRPNVEYHYHIRELIENQEKRTNDRNRSRNKEKEQAEREEDIQRAKPIDIVEFYCSHCEEDFAQIAYKQVETDWSNTNQRIAFYKSKCDDCGTWAIRYITNKYSDPYWSESKQVARDRGKHYADILQPWETGYNLLYGRKNT